MNFIIGLVAGAVAGAVVFYLVLRNNPKLAEKIGIFVDKVDDAIDSVK
jgi:hypothetical protein